MPKDPSAPTPHRGKAREVHTKSRGKTYEPSAQLSEAVTASRAPVEVNVPRPGTTRYPLPREEVYRIKEDAIKAKLLALADAKVSRDKSGKRPELALLAGGPAAAMPAALAPTAAPAAAPTPAVNFAGIPFTNWVPPDCTLAVGPDHVLASVNSSVAVFSRTGAALLPPRTLTQWFAGVAVKGATIFDPKALYDQHARRFVLLAVAFTESPNRSWFLLSVSKTADPLGGWWNYSFDAAKDGTTKTNNWADYPALGVDAHALYLTANMFLFDGDFQYAKVRVVPKSVVYAGGAATYKDLVKLKNADGSLAFTVQPCHTHGAPQVQYLVNSYFPGSTAPVDKLSLWALKDPLGTPTLTRRTVTTSQYALPPQAKQKGGGKTLDSGDTRVLNAVFRGGSVWCALTTRHNWGDGTNVAAVHWFQLEAATGALTQQGVFGAKKLHYFYPAVMPDGSGNMIMVFSRSGTGEFASVYFTGRKATDPPGALLGSFLLKAGTANYNNPANGVNRWGDYAGIAADPVNGQLIWFYSLYAAAPTNWATWIGSAVS
ncbi:MAG TPA: hypothetical protein VF546_03545 [Pyrinomonadaceae bacterium]|jgi:hypothetical protein